MLKQARLHVLQHRKLPATECVHQMRACFNDIIVSSLSAGEKVERLLTGLIPELHFMTEFYCMTD